MIEYKIYHNGDEIGRISVTKISCISEAEADYVAEIGIERLGPERSVGMRRVTVRSFNRLRWNAIGLLQSVLDELDAKDFQLDQPTRPSDMAWGQRSFVRALQDWTSKLRNH